MYERNQFFFSFTQTISQHHIAKCSRHLTASGITHFVALLTKDPPLIGNCQDVTKQQGQVIALSSLVLLPVLQVSTITTRKKDLALPYTFVPSKKKMMTTRTSQEAAQAEAAASADRSAPGRMDQYFKQPPLPPDFKFMEPYIKGNERDWK